MNGVGKYVFGVVYIGFIAFSVVRDIKQDIYHLHTRLAQVERDLRRNRQNDLPK